MSSGNPGTDALPRRLRLLVAAVGVLAVPVVAAAFVWTFLNPPTLSTAIALAVFATLTFVADAKPLPLDETGEHTVSLAFAFVMACLLLFGWSSAVLVAVSAAIASQVVDRRPLARLVFNSSAYGLATFAAGVPLLLLPDRSPTDVFVTTGYVFVGGGLYLAVNVGLVSTAVAFARDAQVKVVLTENIRMIGPGFVTMAFLGALGAVLWAHQPPAIVLLVGPILTLTLYQRSSLASRKARHEALTDRLTAIGNLRAFERDLAAAIERANDGGAEFTLCLVDLDDFKLINDTLGHAAGDAALVELARILRADDAVDAYRLGGDEFAVLIQGGLPAARRLGNRVIAQVGEVALENDMRLGISLGLAAAPAHATKVDALEELADRALYLAKHAGKNQLCIADDPRLSDLGSDDLERMAERSARLRVATELVKVVEAKDAFTGDHCRKVSELSVAIGKELLMDGEALEQLRLAAMLHDLGKVAIPDAILQKPTGLDPDELRIVRTHPELGYRMLEDLALGPVIDWIKHHHEHWDGSGYPDRLVGEEIPIGARIILVADAFDAMTTERTYQAARSVDDTIRELQRLGGTQFDPVAVQALAASLGIGNFAGGARRRPDPSRGRPDSRDRSKPDRRLRAVA